jgi:hypothetical protein
MNIDERLQVLAKSTEALHAAHHEMIEANTRREAQGQRARLAIREGLRKYLEIMSEDPK